MEFRAAQRLVSVPSTSRNKQAPVPARAPNNNTLGTLLSLMVVGAGTAAPMFVLVAIATGLDPFYFIIEDLILPHPYYRSIPVIILALAVRFVLGYLCVIEFLRFGTMVVIIAVIGIFAGLSICKKLKYVFYEKCLHLYVQLRLILCSIQAFTRLCIFILIFGGQFATVLLLWLVFKCYAILSVFIYAAVCILTAYLIALVAMFLPTLARIRTETGGLIGNKLNLHFCTNRMNTRKYYYMSLWRAQQSVYLMCGNYFVLKKGVTMTYLRELITNLVNAVLLVDPMSV